jgi:hypothetical protein
MKEVPGHVGESLVDVWRGGKVLVALERTPLQRARPLQEGRALVAYLIGRGLKPLQEVW